MQKMLFKILSANTNVIRKKYFFLRKEMILYLFGGLSLGRCYLPSASRHAPEFEDVWYISFSLTGLRSADGISMHEDVH